MKVLRAQEMGMCFGVRDALKIAQQVADPTVELCHKHHIAVTHVECAEQLEPEWFDEFDIVGLTAGTSTLDETIDGVQHALEQFALRRRQERSA